jgi:hypothetical protein
VNETATLVSAGFRIHALRVATECIPGDWLKPNA